MPSLIIKAAYLFAALTLTQLALADQTIYSSKLANGWQDWSWAKDSKKNSTISVKSKAWQGLYFHHDSLPLRGFEGIAFKVSGPAKLHVHAIVNGKPLVKDIVITSSHTGWMSVEIPFSKLGLTGGKFNGFWLQAEKAASYEVSSVRLVGG
jgi:hypothetical protein